MADTVRITLLDTEIFCSGCEELEFSNEETAAPINMRRGAETVLMSITAFHGIFEFDNTALACRLRLIYTERNRVTKQFRADAKRFCARFKYITVGDSCSTWERV